MDVTAVVGTIKGAFLLRSDAARERWDIEGPLFKGWKVTASARDERGRTYLATASDVYGAALQSSDDLSDWQQLERGPTWSEDSGRKLNQIWTLSTAADGMWAGVDEAGLFRSADGGATWRGLEGLNEHPTRSGWYPGFGGLCAHAFLVDPRDPRRLWCGISAVGVFRSDDGGTSWQPRNEGVTIAIEDKEHRGIGTCVHALVADPDDADVIWRQDHRGMYRTADGGDRWERIEEGLPSGFGFPIALDPRTKALYAVPLESDEYRVPADGRLAVYRSRDRGDSWHAAGRGLPAGLFYGTVLRGALATDGLDPCGVYLGTTAGTVHVSADGGESWRTLPCTLPRVLSVRAFAGA